MRRVVITGLGLITPIGVGRSQVWEELLRGTSGIGPVQSFDPAEYSSQLGAEVHGFEPEKYIRGLDPQLPGRASQLAIAATRLALEDAGLDGTETPPGRVGVSMGTTAGEPLFIEDYNDIRHESGLEAIPAEVMRRYPCHVIPGHVAMEFGFRGSCVMIPTACAAGNYAIGYGYDSLRLEQADLVVAGGADAFSRVVYSGFARLGAIATDCVRPFDRDRKGMVPAEGAAVVVLEPLDKALERRATIYAEVLGYGLSCDSHHMTATHPEGKGAVKAMKMALEDSHLTSDDVDYVSAHGTGTPNNDRSESTALRTLFGRRADNVPMSSIKSMLGHTMGAASAIEAAACALALHTGVLPPTINHQNPDPECDIDCVPNKARRTNPQVVLNNAFAFGGNNASLCLRRWDG